MDIRSGTFFWPETLTPKPYKALEKDISCDVLIIGGGESGAHCAYFLSETGMDVVLVEKDRTGSGSSSANTGLLQYSNDKMLTSCANSFGEENAVRHYRLCEQALRGLGKLIPSLTIQPDFKRRESLYYASDEADADMLRKEYDMLKKHSFHAEWLSSSDIEKMYGFKKPAGILSGGDAEVNPYKLAISLINAAETKGVRVFEKTEIVGRKFEHGCVMLYTASGACIKAKKVIMAAGYRNQEIRREQNAVLSSSYAIVTNRLAKNNIWYRQSLIWETARPYLYMRTTADNRIIAGGLDEPTIDALKMDSKLVHKRDQLLLEVKKLFPELRIKAEYFWGAVFGSTHDGLPMIKEYPELPHCLFLLGYGGNGTVCSYVLASLIRDHLTGKQNDDLQMYLER
ncbi:NAD(P)/FAD-dependent oxidoreductase [Metabacillus idriensis]|uniref:NAD(P)/FAD-dependent oxidoreductase n=1 Tax=Metabacillus idriensis TaxID=324768 RepID=UPI003D2D9DA7